MSGCPGNVTTGILYKKNCHTYRKTKVTIGPETKVSREK